MSAFAFGKGFVDASKKRIDEERERQAQDRKMLLNNWQQTVLPQVTAQRQKDSAILDRANRYVSTIDAYKNNPELAFAAAKGVVEGAYKNELDFLQAFEKDSTIVPPQVLQKQRETLQQNFAFDVDQTTGKLSNFKFRQQPQTVTAPEEGRPKARTFSQLFTGKRDAGDVAAEAAGAFKKTTGADPTQPVKSQFDGMPSSGTVDLKPVDQEKRKYEEMAAEMAARSPGLKNPGKMIEAVAKGPQAVLEYASTPGAFYSKEELDSKEFNLKVQNALLSDALENGTKWPEGMAVLVSGRMTGQQLADYMAKGAKTPEERAQFKLDNLIKQNMLTPSGQLNWYFVVNSPDMFAKLFPEGTSSDQIEADRIRMQKMLSSMAQSDIFKRILEYKEMEGLLNPGTPPSTGADKLPPPPPTPPAPTPSLGSATEQPLPSEQKRIRRIGEDDTGNKVIDKKVTDAVMQGDLSTVSQANPASVLGAISRVDADSIENLPEVVKSITFTTEDINRIRNEQTITEVDRSVRRLVNVKVVPEYSSAQEAAAELGPGKLYINTTTKSWGITEYAEQ